MSNAMIDGTEVEIVGGKTLVDGTEYDIFVMGKILHEEYSGGEALHTLYYYLTGPRPNFVMTGFNHKPVFFVIRWDTSDGNMYGNGGGTTNNDMGLIYGTLDECFVTSAHFYKSYSTKTIPVQFDKETGTLTILSEDTNNFNLGAWYGQYWFLEE